MSLHVYIAREGFKETPILLPEWLMAARQCEELQIEQRKVKARTVVVVTLKGDPRARLSRTPYGLIDAQNPSSGLVSVMFKLAQMLNAGVYSEDLERYDSVEDWDRRTAGYRYNLGLRRAIAKRRRRLSVVILVLFMLFGAVVGLLTVR